MFVIYNVIGLAMALIGTAVALLTNYLKPEDLRGPAPLALGVTWLVIDLAYRIRKGSRRLFHWRHGGQLFFVPIWCWGIFCLFIGYSSLGGSIKERQEKEQHQQRGRDFRARSTT